MPSMQKLYNEFNGKNFEILAVSIDADGVDAVAPFMKTHKLSFPALMDPKGTIKSMYRGTIKSMYRVTGVPESFIIDKQGILVGKIIGPRDWATQEVFGFFQDLIQRPLSAKNE
jgi:peroxiredoxin